MRRQLGFLFLFAVAGLPPVSPSLADDHRGFGFGGISFGGGHRGGGLAREVIQRLVNPPARPAQPYVHHNPGNVARAPQSQDCPYFTRQNVYYYAPAPPTDDPAATAQPAVPLEFGAFDHVEDLATRLQGLANDLCWDLHSNYRHNTGFDATYAQAYQILEIAKVVRQSDILADRRQIVDRLTALDGSFHRVQGGVRGWNRRQERQVGEFGIVAKLEKMEPLIHYLTYNAGIEVAHDAQPETAKPALAGSPPTPDPPAAPGPKPAKSDPPIAEAGNLSPAGQSTVEQNVSDGSFRLR